MFVLLNKKASDHFFFYIEQKKKKKTRCQYTDRLLTDASTPVAANRVHFLFWEKKGVRQATGL